MPMIGTPVAQRQLLHLDDLLGGDLAQRAAEDRRVIRVNGHRPPVDLPESRDHAVAGDPAVLHPETVGAVRGEEVELDERAVVEQHLDAVARGGLAGCAPLVRRFGLGMQRLVAALSVLVDLLLGDGGRRRAAELLRLRGSGWFCVPVSAIWVCGQPYRIS